MIGLRTSLPLLHRFLDVTGANRFALTFCDLISAPPHASCCASGRRRAPVFAHFCCALSSSVQSRWEERTNELSLP